MDERAVLERAEAHGEAMRTGDLARAALDLDEGARAQASEVMKALPRKIDSAEVGGSEADGDALVVEIVYAGEGRRTSVRSRWAEREGGLRIVGLEVV
jgi:hypothetical protein